MMKIVNEEQHVVRAFNHDSEETYNVLIIGTRITKEVIDIHVSFKFQQYETCWYNCMHLVIKDGVFPTTEYHSLIQRLAEDYVFEQASATDVINVVGIDEILDSLDKSILKAQKIHGLINQHNLF